MTRKHTEIDAAIDRLFDQVWYTRHQFSLHRSSDEERRQWREHWQEAEAAAKQVEAKVDELGPWTDFEWGMINGKLSALRWVRGSEWDFLDT